jgi:hypothetical protein
MAAATLPGAVAPQETTADEAPLARTRSGTRLTFGAVRTDAASLQTYVPKGTREEDKAELYIQNFRRKQRGARALQAVLLGPTLINWISACYATWIGTLYVMDTTGVEHNMQMAQTYNYMAIFFAMTALAINTIFIRESDATAQSADIRR